MSAATEAPASPVLRVALTYMPRGWPVVPIYAPDPSRPTGCSCRDHECSSPAKHPTTRRGIHDASTEERLARIWWERHPRRGIALATGEPSGVWVLDLDGEKGKCSFLALQEDQGRIPNTVASRTGGGGFHLLFRMPGNREVKNSAGQVGDGIDVRGTGGYVILPPSGHVSGRRYAWLRGRSPGEIAVADAPAWLLDLVAPPQGDRPAAGRKAPPLDEIIPGPNDRGGGRRNQTLASLAGSLRRRGLVEEEILPALQAVNARRCRPPLPDADLVRIARSVARYPASAPLTGAGGGR